MAVFANIQRLLDTRLKSLPSSPFIAWPNAEVRPGNSALTEYVRPSLLLASTELHTVNDRQRIPGIYQVDIYGQLNRGVRSTYALADEIKEHFEDDRDLTQDSTLLLIQNISMGPAEREESWYKVVVEINFICYD